MKSCKPKTIVFDTFLKYTNTDAESTEFINILYTKGKFIKVELDAEVNYPQLISILN